MKKLALLILFSTSVYAQEEPETIKAKDLIEVDKPEFENEDIDIVVDDFLGTMEIPMMDTSLETTKKPKAKAVKKTQPKIKATKDKPTVSSEASKPKSKEIVISTTKLDINMLKKNDLIRKELAELNVYRRISGNITKFNFIGLIDMSSSGLENKSETTFYVRNIAKLRTDTKKIKKEQLQAKRKEEKLRRQTINDAQKRAKELETKPEAQFNVVSDSTEISKRKEIEDKQNHGKKIKKEILLKNLQSNDMIYLFGDIQLVHRKNKSTSGTKKMWLTEPIDSNNPSLEKINSNQFKVTRKYKQ